MAIEPRIASPYGPRQRPSGVVMHQGIDIVADEGHPVYAVLPGVVTHATENGAPGFSNYGHTVVVEHAQPKVWSLYAHLLRPAVVPGQRVAQGELLGWVGKSRGRYDRSTGQSIPDFFHASVPHLHFEVRTRSLPAAYGAGNLDPERWLAAYGLPLPTSPAGAPAVAAPPSRPAWTPPEPVARPAGAPARPRVRGAAWPVGLLGLGLAAALGAVLARSRG